MAAGLLKSLVNRRDIEVVSAGTAAVPGVPASEAAVRVMQDEGIDISGHMSQVLDGFLLEEADHVIVMTEGHLRTIIDWFKGMKDKVHLIREYDTVTDDDLYPNVPDPIGRPVEEYRRIKDILKRSIIELERTL